MPSPLPSSTLTKLVLTRKLPEFTRSKQFGYACEALAWHFAGIPLDRPIGIATKQLTEMTTPL